MILYAGPNGSFLARQSGSGPVQGDLLAAHRSKTLEIKQRLVYPTSGWITRELN